MIWQTTVLLLVLILTGCMNFELSSDANITQDSSNKSETVHGTMWGQWYWKDYNIQKCNDGPLARTENTFTAPQLFLSAVTLGFYVPQTVEWWCQDVSTGDDSDEPGLRPEGEGR